MSEATDYYRRRADAERELALETGKANVAAIHEELARMYDALVDHPELQPDELRLACA